MATKFSGSRGGKQALAVWLQSGLLQFGTGLQAYFLNTSNSAGNSENSGSIFNITINQSVRSEDEHPERTTCGTTYLWEVQVSREDSGSLPNLACKGCTDHSENQRDKDSSEETDNEPRKLLLSLQQPSSLDPKACTQPSGVPDPASEQFRGKSLQCTLHRELELRACTKITRK